MSFLDLSGLYHRLKINGRIAALVVACILPTWMLTGYFAVTSYQQSREILNHTLLEASHSQMRMVEREISAMESALRALATSPNLDRGDFAGFHGQAVAVLGHSPGLNIVLLGAAGEQLVNTLKPFGEPLPTNPPELFARLLETRQPVLADLFIGPVTKRPLVSLVVPVLREGRVAFAIGMSLDAEHLGLILKQQDLPEVWAAAVFDSRGTIVARTAAPEKYVGKKGVPAVLASLQGPPRGLVETRTLDDHTVLLAYSRSPLYGWTVAVAAHEADLTADLRRSIWFSLIGGAVLLLIGLALARWMARGITHPIRALIAPATAIGRGEPVTVAPLYLREADDVGRALVSAAALLRQRTAERDSARVRELEMQQQHSVLRALNDIAALPGADTEWQLVESLRVGARYLRLPLGILSRIEGDLYTVLHHCAPEEFGLADGQEFQLGHTYCAITIEANAVVAIRDLERSEHAGHPCYAAFGLKSYIGAPVMLRNRCFGTVNFSSTQAREGGFDAGDREFMRLLARWIGTVLERQISDREITAAKVELERSNEELERFAFVASHDLRQPLRMVNSYLTLIKRRIQDRLDDEEKQFLAFAVDGATRMDRMIIDLLEYSRIGRGNPDMVAVDLGDAVRQAQGSLGVAITEAGAEIVVTSNLPTVKGNESELVRLFQNLIGNAVKFRAPGRRPCVVVESREMADEWIISVADNGIGIASEDFSRLFAVFQRLVSQERYEGTGIGLAACRKICQRHGGRIWLDSQPDQGSTFFVALPK